MADTDLKTIVQERAPAGFSRVRVAMVLTDPHQEDNPIIYANDAFVRTTGYSHAAILGRNCRFLQGEDTDKRDVDAIRHGISSGDGSTTDILNYRANGQPFVNRLIIAPVSDENGNTRYFLGIQKELGERDRKSAAAEQAEQLEGMLTRLTGDLAMLMRSVQTEDDTDPMDFDALSRRLECMQLVYEEMRLQDAHLSNAGLDLGALLSRVGAAVAHENGRSGVRYSQSVEPIESDLDTALRVALLTSELVSNAFVHAFDRMEQGLVEMQVSRLAAGGLRLTVTDDGVGFPSTQDFPDTDTRGGRMTRFLLEGLDATLNHVRGAAGSVFIIDVPLGG